jgi:hypothetical protein
MTLARAFQLMSQALTELRGPVTQDALRLRMAALHGRDDALLDSTRFPRLLRQANDAEIADVRKVGEDDYEISLHRSAALAAPSAPAAPRAEAAPQPAEPEGAAQPEPSGAAAGAGRDNGSRFGVRFRRGSRGSSRPGEIPLIGVVQMEVAPDESAPAESSSDVAAEQAPAKKPARTRRAPRKKAAAAAATTAAPAAEEAAPAKRPRARAKKKPE